MRIVFIMLITIWLSGCAFYKPTQRSQNPSPMEEHIRPHERVEADTSKGNRMTWEFYDKKVQLYIPENNIKNDHPELVVHFHGLPRATEYAVEEDTTVVMATVYGGSGGSSYEKIFLDEDCIDEFLTNCEEKMGRPYKKLTLAGWSAGYGAIRAIIRTHPEKVDRVILLDGLHTGYVPDRQVLFEGGQLDTLLLEPFVNFARLAIAGEKEFLITHTSIFPGTFASTTECTDYLLQQTGLSRQPELAEWPLGLQQVGHAGSGQFKVLSFAGNTAPDHVDHLHALRWFLALHAVGPEL